MPNIAQDKADIGIPLEAKEHYYAIEINDVLCGYSHEVIEPIVKDDKDILEMKVHALILQSVLGGSADLDIITTKKVDPKSGQYLFIDSEIRQGGVLMGSSIVVEGSVAKYTSKMTGESKDIELDDEVILDNGSFYTFVMRDISDNLDKEYKTIETMEGKIDSRHIQFEEKEKIELNGKVFNSIRLKEVFVSSGASAKVWIDDKSGYILKREFSNGRKIYLTDEGVTKKIQVAKLDDVLFAKVDKVIKDVSNISYLKVEAKINSAGEVLTPEKLNFKGQKFEGTVEENFIDGVFEISHERYDGSGAPGFPYDYSSDEELTKYLEPENFIESDDPVLIKKAKELTTGAKDSWEAATLISGWVAKNISYAIPGGVTARKTFDIGNGECGAHSRLTAALCRAVGIPAKFVIGCMYSNTYGGTFGQHAWNEVYMGEAGWIPIDATALEKDYIDSGHIRLGEKTSFNPQGMKIIDYKINDEFVAELEVPEKYQKYVGNFIGPNSGKPFEVSFKNDGLAVQIPDQMQIELYDPDEKGMWYAKITNQLYFSFEDDGTDKSPYMHLHQITPAPKTSSPDSIDSSVPEKYRPYLGDYYFAAITNNVTVVYQDSTLAVKDPTYSGLIRLQPPDENGMWMDQFDQNGLIFKFNDNGEVTQIDVVGEYVMEREW